MNSKFSTKQEGQKEPSATNPISRFLASRRARLSGLFAAATLGSPVAVFADEPAGLQQMANLITNLANSAKPIVLALSILALFIVGALFIYPSETTRRTAKTALPYIVIGVMIANGATYFAGWVSGQLAF